MQSYNIGPNYKKVEVIDLEMKAIQKGESLVIENVYFNKKSYQLKPMPIGSSNKLAEFLKENKGVTIEVSGHTDDMFNRDYSVELSQQRAKSVVGVLVVEEGVDKSRLSFKVYGDTQPLKDNFVKAKIEGWN